MHYLSDLDRFLFFAVNHDLSNPYLDWLAALWRNKTTWIPLYILTAGWLVYKLKAQGIYILLLVVFSTVSADIISSHLIKKTVQRVRPCRETALQGQVFSPDGCGSGFSFPSSHAANHFALATALVLALRLKFRRRYKLWGWYAWAAGICLAQVYVGVHYPSDVFFGALLGMGIGRVVVGLGL